jgi:hypothetical protein
MRRHGTVSDVCTDCPPQAMLTGQFPGVVLVPTVQLRETFPLASSVVFGPSPCPPLGPLLYRTVMVQPVDGAPFALIDAVRPRVTVPGGFVTTGGSTLVGCRRRGLRG